MEHNATIIILEILAGIVLALYLLRRVTLTFIYCVILIKAAARAIRRQYRRASVHWRYFRTHNPHGFIALWAQSLFSILSFAIPQFVPTFLAWVWRGYIHAESYFVNTLCPAIYRQLPLWARQFCDWALNKVARFTAKRIAARRQKYAVASYYRWQKRVSADGARPPGTCPMRYLLPSSDNLRVLAKK